MPMANLKSVFESLDCKHVQTYIQSGNVVFDSRIKSKRTLTNLLLNATEEEFGFRPQLLLLTTAEFVAAGENNPFTKAAGEPKSLHFFFLESNPTSPDLDSLNERAIESEQFKLVDSVFYLHAPDGIGRSKLAAVVERKLGLAATARNYATVNRLAEMLAERDSVK